MGVDLRLWRSGIFKLVRELDVLDHYTFLILVCNSVKFVAPQFISLRPFLHALADSRLADDPNEVESYGYPAIAHVFTELTTEALFIHHRYQPLFQRH